MTEGLPLPEVLYLSDRETALGQLDIRPSENAHLVSLVKEAIGSDRETSLLVSARAWPLLACRMARTARGPEGGPGLSPHGEADLRTRLKTLADDPAWKQGPASKLTGRLVAATLTALNTPPGTPGPTGPPISPTAARSRSTATAAAVAKPGAASTEAAVPAHRQRTTPTRRQGRGH
ncbi:hypothetical protein ACFUIV_22385 [Streptomyces anulatus]|uniref:hypothetical protein n=1 Tax=Streptomyces anulatus TaxID=1892 RepID=UPI00363C0778